MRDNLISWSVKNWVTVFLMWLLGWAVLSVIIRAVSGKQKLPAPADTGAGAMV